jgi:hypothetical protein
VKHMNLQSQNLNPMRTSSMPDLGKIDPILNPESTTSKKK